MSIDDTLYETRLLVFMEAEPQSNKYYQVIFTPEEFLRVSKAIGKIIDTKPDGKEIVETTQSDEVYTLPDLQSYQPLTIN